MAGALAQPMFGVSAHQNRLRDQDLGLSWRSAPQCPPSRNDGQEEAPAEDEKAGGHAGPVLMNKLNRYQEL
jgi:hypothetical protein